jgi:hypothetical protein
VAAALQAWVDDFDYSAIVAAVNSAQEG